MRATAEGGVTAIVDKGPLEGLDEISKGAEVRVVAVPLSGQHDVQGVVEIIVPLRIDAVPADLWRSHDTGIVEVTLRDEDQMAPELPCEGVHLGCQLFEKVHR